MTSWVIDAEGDGLAPTKLHVLSAKQVDGNKVFSTNSYDKMRKLLTEADELICHNLARFDVPVFERILGIKIKAKLIDTLAISWYLEPKRPRHGLEQYGVEFGVPKPVVVDWENLSYEEYKHRCEEDVEINWRLWKHQKRTLLKLYGSEEETQKLLDYLEFKMDCAAEQERSRWKLDIKLAQDTLDKLTSIRETKVLELAASMPRVQVFEEVSRPRKCVKNDGTISVAGHKWFQTLEAGGYDDDYDGTVRVLVSDTEGNPKAHQQVKDWLFELGWVPRKFEHKRNKKTGDLKSIPQIRDKDTGELCESVQELFDIEPKLEVLSGLSVLNHRIPILQGLLDNCDSKGYVYAGIAGLTNTMRFKHAVVVNFPKADKPYGKEIRGCLIAPEGEILCGADMSSLEDKIKQHFIFPHDPEYVKSLDTPGYDPHLAIAVLSKMMTQADFVFYTQFKSGDDPIRYKHLKTVRGKAKTVNYAGQYGAGPPRIALSGNIPLEEAKLLHKTYWELNWAIKVVAKEQTWKTIDDQMWLLNPISKLWYSLRFEKDIFSTLVQGTASYVFDLWAQNFRKHRPQLTGQFHDEVVLSIRQGAQDKCKQLLFNAIDETNAILKLNVPLAIDVQFGSNYADIH